MSLLLNMLSRLCITFLPRSKHLLISWLQSLSAMILEPPKIKVWHCFQIYPSVIKLVYLSILKTLLSILSEKAMTPHSSTLAWKIPWMEEPGRLQSMRSLRVGHDWATSLPLFTFMHWRRKWQPTPVFLPGESQGRENLLGCCLWSRTESDTAEVT